MYMYLFYNCRFCTSYVLPVSPHLYVSGVGEEDDQLRADPRLDDRSEFEAQSVRSLEDICPKNKKQITIKEMYDVTHTLMKGVRKLFPPRYFGRRGQVRWRSGPRGVTSRQSERNSCQLRSRSSRHRKLLETPVGSR